MRKALYILGHLSDGDMQWLATRGRRRKLRDGEVIIREGIMVDAVFLTLEGGLAVSLANGQRVASLGAGEIVGEIAFVDSAPPSATVTAEKDAVVLEVKKVDLQRRIDTDAAFAARFYRALAVFLAARLRTTTRRLGYGKAGDLASEEILDDELESGVLDRVAEAGERFQRLLTTIAAG